MSGGVLFASMASEPRRVEARELSVGRDAVNAFIVDAALNVVAEEREDRQQAREELGERVVEGAAERRHDRRPRARAGAAERVAPVLRVVFMIRRRGRRRRLHLQMEGGCAFWPNARWGGSRAARFCAAGEGLPVSPAQQPFCAGARRAPSLLRTTRLVVRCDVPSARRVRLVLGRKRSVRKGVGVPFSVCVVASH